MRDKLFYASSIVASSCLFILIGLGHFDPAFAYAHELFPPMPMLQFTASARNASLPLVRNGVPADDLQKLSTMLGRPQKASEGHDVALTDQVQTAKQRGSLMRALAKADPKLFLANALPNDKRASLAAAVAEEVERPVTLAGSLDVFHEDNFSDEKKSRFAYVLHSGDTSYTLYFAGNAPALTSESQVEVAGYQLGNIVVSSGSKEALKVQSSPKPESVGSQSTLFFLITTPDKPTPPSPSVMRSKIFNGPFEQYYEEQSYGKVRFSGMVTNWITVPSGEASWCGMPNIDHPAIQQYLVQNKIDLARYGRVVFVMNGQGGGCAGVGKSTYQLNGRNYRFSAGWVGFIAEVENQPNPTGMTSFQYVLSHEMGHELGVMHANSWSCTGPSLDADCTHIEYGNSYDVMGGGWNAAHFNAYYKDLLGWLDSASKLSVTLNGSYSLTPLESRKGVRAIGISNPALPTTAPLYVEYRRPIGFDSALSPSGVGLHLNQVITFAQPPFTRLLNANYLSDPSASQPLTGGSAFTWPSHGIQIDSLTTGTTSATFHVTVTTPQCTVHGLSISDVQFRPMLAAGGYDGLQFFLTNNDTAACNARALTVLSSVSDADQWYLYQYPQDGVTLAPGESTYVFLSISAPQTATLGDHTVTVTITDTATGETMTKTYTLTIIAAPSITSISPTWGLPGTTITLRGNGFAPPKDINNVYVQNDSYLGAGINSLYANEEGTELIFTFPTSLPVTATSSIATPFGHYLIYMYRGNDGAMSNVIDFTVSTSSATSSPPTKGAPSNTSVRQSTTTTEHSKTAAPEQLADTASSTATTTTAKRIRRR